MKGKQNPGNEMFKESKKKMSSREGSTYFGGF